MAMNIGDLFGTLDLEDKMTGKLNSAGEAAQKFGGIGAIAGAQLGVAMELGRIAVEKLGGSVSAVITSITDLGAKAEQISNKQLSTGFTGEAVQSVMRLADVTGVSSDRIFMAMNRVQRSAEANATSFRKLGISSAEFVKMSPDKAFETLAHAVMSVENPTQRVALAMELAGRSGAELIPAFNELVKGSNDLNVSLGDDQVEALARLDDNIDVAKGAYADFKDQMVSIVATTPELSESIRDVALMMVFLARNVKATAPEMSRFVSFMVRIIDLGGAIDALNIAGILIPENLPKVKNTWGEVEESILSGDEALKELTRGLREDKVAFADADKAAKAFDETMSKLEKQLTDASAQAEKEVLEIIEDRFVRAEKAAADMAHTLDERAWDDWEKGLSDAEKALTSINAEADNWELDQLAKETADSYEGMATESEALEDNTERWSIALKGVALLAGAVGGKFSDVLNVMGNITEEFRGWNTKSTMDKFGAVASGVGQVGGLIGGRAGGALSGAAGGAMMGASIGSIIPGIGTVVGGVAGGIAGGVSGLLGGNKEVMELNDIRDAFFEAHGGWLQLQQDLSILTEQDLVKKIFDADTVTEFNTAVGQAMALLDTQTMAQEELNAAIEKYGFTLEELPMKMRQDQIDANFAQTLKEFELLKAAGFDMNLIIEKMGPNMSEFVNQAIAAGATIPEAMRPMVEQMIVSGQLLDENGEAFTSVEDAGITFAQTMSEQFTTLIDKIDEMVDALLRINNINVSPRINFPQPPNYNDTFDSIPRHAAGGIVTSPQLGIVGESGPEAIIPLSEMPGMMGQGGIDEGTLRALLDQQSRVMTKAVRDALLQSGRN